jgi:CHAT domain-containing protein
LNVNDNFFENLTAFIDLVDDNGTFDHADRVKEYEKLAHHLYNVLLNPINTQLSERLQIIPDGVLSLLPFDALLTDKVKKSGFYSEYPFLLKEKAIQYNFSASMWSEMLNAEGAKTSEMLCAYAPIFNSNSYVADRSNDSIQVGSLKYNQEEAKTARKIFKGKLYSGATSREFKSSCSDCKIVHIASHAKASTGIQDESWILFNSEEDYIDDEKLQLHEIYNLDLNSELLVLSACETASGKMVKGEGILSFARSFSFAGTKSILTSLWRVDDEATKEIMTIFYKNLRLGQSKDLALQKAKIQYLNSARKNAPNYWAAFVAVGDMTPISPSPAPLIFWIIFPIAIIIWYVIRKKRMNSK